MAMDKDVKKRWVDALRSGEYKQGRGALCYEEESSDGESSEFYFCCLGVLIDVELYGDWETREVLNFSEKKTLWTFNENILTLGESQGRRFGLTNDQEDYLTQLNDYISKSFDYIADWIDMNIPVRGDKG